MSSVHQTQPMIQLLLSTPDYVAALDLIQTSQEMSQQKLPGIHSFRYFFSSFYGFFLLLLSIKSYYGKYFRKDSSVSYRKATLRHLVIIKVWFRYKFKWNYAAVEKTVRESGCLVRKSEDFAHCKAFYNPVNASLEKKVFRWDARSVLFRTSVFHTLRSVLKS